MSQVVGRYELLRPLGRGGMAEVFHARRRGPGGVEKRLVVKRIRRERSADPRFVQLFVQEARLSMSLAHKNIVPVFDFGRIGDELFLVMEYVDGPDLAAAIECGATAGQAIDPELAAFVALEACQALDYAHRARDEAGAPRAIVHRDVTTRNVLVSSSGEVKLVDFGVATSETDIGARKVRGTPAYMSPEQARGDTVDARSDVFSLGLVLYELLAGKRAHTATRNAELLEQARRGEVAELPESVPAELRAIVARATAADPDERFGDARAMQLALDSFLVKARAQSGGPPPSVRLAGWIEAIWSRRDGDPGVVDADSSGAEAPSGPVITFLDDGEQALTSMAAGDETLQSMAATLSESVIGTAVPDGADNENQTDDPVESDDADEQSQTRRDATGRGAWFPWTVAGVVVIFAAMGVSVVVDSDGSETDVVRPTAAAPTAPGGSPRETPDSGAERTAKADRLAPDPATAQLDDAAARTSDDDELGAGVRPPDRDGIAAVPSPARSPGGTRATTPGKTGDDRQRGAVVDATDAEKPRGQTPRRPSTTKANASATASDEQLTGTVAIAVRPWAKVSVAGRDESCAETPCRIRLPPGRHVLRLEHTVWNVAKTVEVDVRADDVTQVSEVLLQPR